MGESCETCGRWEEYQDDPNLINYGECGALPPLKPARMPAVTLTNKRMGSRCPCWKIRLDESEKA